MIMISWPPYSSLSLSMDWKKFHLMIRLNKSPMSPPPTCVTMMSSIFMIPWQLDDYANHDDTLMMQRTQIEPNFSIIRTPKFCVDSAIEEIVKLDDSTVFLKYSDYQLILQHLKIQDHLWGFFIFVCCYHWMSSHFTEKTVHTSLPVQPQPGLFVSIISNIIRIMILCSR